MDNNYIQNLLNDIDWDKTKCKTAQFLAFKTKKRLKTQCNQYTNLEHIVYDTQMPSSTTIDLMKDILDMMTHTIFKDNYTYLPFDFKNPRDSRDYIDLSPIDFSNTGVLDGSYNGLDHNTYKAADLVRALKNSIPAKKEDYSSLKFTAFRYVDQNNKSIILINKNTPILKAKSSLFTLDLPTDDEERKPVFGTMTDKLLIKVPKVPNILIIGNECFMFQKYSSSIFGFEEHSKLIRDEKINSITSASILTAASLDILKKSSTKVTTCNLFINFNDDRLEKIKSKDADTLAFLTSKLNISFTGTGEIELNNEDTCITLIEYLCNKVFKDIENDDEFYSAHKAKPIK